MNLTLPNIFALQIHYRIVTFSAENAFCNVEITACNLSLEKLLECIYLLLESFALYNYFKLESGRNHIIPTLQIFAPW